MGSPTAGLEQDEGAGGGVPGEDREVDPAGQHGGPEGQRKPGPQREAGMVVGRVDIDARHGRGTWHDRGNDRWSLLEQLQEAGRCRDIPEILRYAGTRNRSPHCLRSADEQEKHAQTRAGERH